MPYIASPSRLAHGGADRLQWLRWSTLQVWMAPIAARCRRSRRCVTPVALLLLLADALCRLAPCLDGGERVLQYLAHARHAFVADGVGVEKEFEAGGMLADHLGATGLLQQAFHLIGHDGATNALHTDRRQRAAMDDIAYQRVSLIADHD